MLAVKHISLLLLLTIASSLAQLITLDRSEPGLSIAQQIGDGIRNVPIPPPWYFLKNKYYWTQFQSTTEGRVTNNFGQDNGYTPDLVSKFNTDFVTQKIQYVSTEPIRQNTFVPTYQPPVINAIPSTTVASVLPIALTNGHSGPIYTSESPQAKLPTTTIKSEVTSTIATDNAGNQNSLALLFSGTQICKKQNAYFGVGENHSFYVECKDYQPAVRLCDDKYSFDSNVQWPENPCKKDAETLPQTQ